MSDDKKIITRKQVLDLMCQIVGEYGVDYVYTKIDGSCSNWDRDRSCPSCLIGHVVSRLGASDGFLDAYRTESAASLLGSFSRSYGYEIEHGVMDILGTAQLAQDGLKSWGEALRRALTEHGEILKNLAARELDIPKAQSIEDEVQE